MNDTVIGILHTAVASFFAFYGILFNKNRLDYIYLFIMYFLLLHWTFFNGECVISYWIKLKNDPDYIPGEDPHKSEMSDLYANDTLKYIVQTIISVAWIYTLYVVFIRNKIGILFTTTFLFLYILYKGSCMFYTNHRSHDFLIIQDIAKYSLILYGIFLLPLLYKKFVSKRR